MKIINIIAITIILTLNSCGQFSHQKFDSNKWKTSNLNLEENWDLRWKMMNDLRNNYSLIGKSKNEIEKLLGKTEIESENEFSYYLGMTGTGINTGRLIIYFDENSKVKQIKVTQG